MTTSKRPSDAEPGDPRGHEATLAANLRKDQVRAALFGAAKTPQRVGRYVVEEVLGEGAMGTVFVGFDPQLDRHVAIKQIKGDDDEARRARMLREAQALARLSHPNVVPVYEVGEHEGRLFFAMERVKGTSLHAWQQAQDHGWRTVVEHYMQAGRGLAAAHAVGLVHRDFKPHNAVVGDDGRVRVLDFGVAGTDRQRVAVDEADVTASATDSRQDWIRTPLTSTGAVVGTPAYMAPEQLHGSEVSHHADQYAFCVALYEGLYGRRPIDMAGVRRMLAGDRIEAAPPPAGTAVPRRVWATLQRGLSPEPEARFDSMDALLVALDPSRARRRRVVMAVGVVGTGLLGALAMAGDREQPCLPDPTALADAWNDERRAEIREAFAATGLPFAGTTADYAEQTLQSWSDTWVQARSDACRAARVDQVETEARMEARMACLERQRQVLGAFTEVLAEADGKTVGRADEVLAGLPDVAACARTELDEERYPRPADPAALAEIETVLAGLARARAMKASGHRTEALEVAEAALAQAARLQFPPLKLEAEWLLATFDLERGSLDKAIEVGMTLAWRAEALRLDDLVATIRLELAEQAVGEWSRPDRERWLLSGAEAALARVGADADGPDLRLQLLQGRLQRTRGDVASAVRTLRSAVALAQEAELTGLTVRLRIELGRAFLDQTELSSAREQFRTARRLADSVFGRTSVPVASAEFNLGLVALAFGDLEGAERHNDLASETYRFVVGRYSLGFGLCEMTRAKLAMNRAAFDEGLAHADSAVDIFSRVVGNHALETAQAYGARGVFKYFLGHHEASIADYERAHSGFERLLGARSTEAALVSSNIGESRLALAQPELAVSRFDSAVASIRSSHGDDHPLLAVPYKGQGLALLAVGRPRAAVASFERSLAIHAAHPGEPFEAAETRYALARALAATDPASSRAIAQAAAEEFASLRAAARVEEVQTFMQQQSRRAKR